MTKPAGVLGFAWPSSGGSSNLAADLHDDVVHCIDLSITDDDIVGFCYTRPFGYHGPDES
jgi:hypothetical protein